ncbi:hypothetical protein [Streptomyces sp. CC224B]|uniref:hypothetical protein n=1 Tax=Streptomyces sp. CC224B TaxID=3044571 RepID=UPI0024A8AD1B|nr:hypothetical protein [Streptomyces sp. CC224B]
MSDITGQSTGSGSGPGTVPMPPIQLPDPAALAEEQVCGRRCVWCTASLNNTIAVDLGAREVDAHGSGARWFPRGCRSCAYANFCERFQEHRTGCQQCSTGLPWCVTGQKLFGAAVRINRQGWR